MRIALVVDGRPEEVVVDLAEGTVSVRGTVHPLRVLRADGRVEIEVDGESLVVEGWPEGLAKPPGPVSVNGERVDLQLNAVEAARSLAPTVARTTPERSSPASPSPEVGDPGGPGTPILPPMPGKVIEVRVVLGDRVTRGQVLLVLEAMKMRNEVVSPTDGVVVEVRVAPGTNVRAREPMVRVGPG